VVELMGRRRRASAVPIIVVVVVLLIGLIGTTFAAPAARPAQQSTAPVSLPGRSPDQTAVPLPTPLGRYPATAEVSLVRSCLSGIDPNTVPDPLAQAFCVCTLNAYEQLYPTYDRFQQGIASGTITDELRTQISTRCAQALVGG
jgi:hypothetical protein